jgi:catechol 2,3-dioxygenase-like lactoylglutathione lyase family enzyme
VGRHLPPQPVHRHDQWSSPCSVPVVSFQILRRSGQYGQSGGSGAGMPSMLRAPVANGRDDPRAHPYGRRVIAARGADRLRTLPAMSCRISELVLDCADPERLAAFWCEVLEWAVVGRDEESVEIGPAEAGFGGPQPTLLFSRSSDPRRGKLPLHIDVNPTDRDRPAELERLLALGARRVDVGQSGDEPWDVLADPEGNEFCLLQARIRPV